MKKLFTMLFLLILCFPALALSANYYVDQAGSGSGVGSEGDPWKNISEITGLNAGDIVYFDSADTWTDGTANTVISAVGGVQYIGDEWGAGTRAKIQSTANKSWGILIINDDDATNDTVFKGFEVDGGSYQADALIGIGYPANPAMSANLTGATKRVRNCVVHDNDPGTGGDWDYGIIVSARGSYDIDDVEFINNTVYNIGEEGISVYSETGQSGTNSNVLVRGNTVYNTGQDQVNYSDGIIITRRNTNITVEFNTLHDNNYGILIEPYGGETHTNIIVRYNIVYDNLDGIPMWGSGVASAYIYGNLVFSNDNYGIVLYITLNNASNAVYVYNNTLWNVGATADFYVHSSANFTTLEWKDNIAYPVGISDSGTNITASATNLTTNPTFKNTLNLPTGFSGTYGTDMIPNNDGLSIESGAALDTGTDLGSSPYYGAINMSGTSSGDTRDIRTPWDIGAYELIPQVGRMISGGGASGGSIQ